MTLRLRTGMRRTGFVLAIMGMISLAGCDEALVLVPGAIDPSDSCSRFQQDIVDARTEANSLRVQNIAAGAVVGAVLGSMVGAPEDRGRNAAIGAVLGAGLAGAATEQQQRSQREADAAVLRDVNTQAGAANTLLTKAGRSAASLRNCRQGQITQLARDVRANRVSIPDARAQLSVLQRRASADNQIISASFNGIGNRVDSFVQTGAQASGVEAAILNRQAQATNAAQRSARSATPNVARAQTTRVNVANADARAKARIDRELSALESLVSG